MDKRQPPLIKRLYLQGLRTSSRSVNEQETDSDNQEFNQLIHAHDHVKRLHLQCSHILEQQQESNDELIAEHTLFHAMATQWKRIQSP